MRHEATYLESFQVIGLTKFHLGQYLKILLKFGQNGGTFFLVNFRINITTIQMKLLSTLMSYTLTLIH